MSILALSCENKKLKTNTINKDFYGCDVIHYIFSGYKSGIFCATDLLFPCKYDLFYISHTFPVTEQI